MICMEEALTLVVLALAAAVTCASVALTETGVGMWDLPVACLVVGAST